MKFKETCYTEPCHICQKETNCYVSFLQNRGYTNIDVRICSKECEAKLEALFWRMTNSEEKTVTVNTIHNSREEIYTEFYLCPNCKSTNITKYFKHCPECGFKIIFMGGFPND